MGVTSRGFLYMEDHHPLADVAKWIKDLATSANDRGYKAIQTGSVSVTFPAQQAVTVPVTFATGRFSTPPFVALSVDTTRPDVVAVSPGAITATGFQIQGYRNLTSSSTTTVYWHAVER